jgi:hypothetical protein
VSSQYDFSRIGIARREAIRALDDYGCTIIEQLAVFGVKEATFHRYADGVRFRRRPSRIFYPGCADDPECDGDKPDELPIPRADALEIATIALIKSRSGFSVDEIVRALRKTSNSAAYRQRKAYIERLGDLSEVEKRCSKRHLPSHLTDHQSAAEKARERERRYRRWVTRARKQSE